MVSVIMPAYNAEKYIALAIESILSQTYDEFELIIIDDCSTDSTMSVVEQYTDSRIHVYHNECNKGIAYSRNRALSVSKGKYIAIMDDDDIAFPERFEKQAAFLEQNEDIGIVGGRVECIDENGVVISPSTVVLNNPLYIKVNFLFKCIFHNSEVMFRKEIITHNDIHYHDKCYGMEDFRFWIECSKVAKMTNIDEPMLKHRYFAQSETSRVKREEYPQRIAFFDYLQRLSFTLSGFELDDTDFQIINKCFSEGKLSIRSGDEFTQIFSVMKKTVQQAKLKNMDFVKELEIYYKKQLGYAIASLPDIWL